MNRRSFLTGAAGAAFAPHPRRNVLLIYCEQLQHGAGSFAGGPARTPNLEKLAAASAVFRTACTTTGLCSPSRAALFTGRLGHRTALDDNCGVWHSRLDALDPRQTTLLEWARRKNCFTGCYGKWHLGPDGPIQRGVDRYPASGFERNRLRAKTQKPDFEAPKRYYDKTRAFPEKPGFYQTQKGGYEQSPTAQVARQAAAFLKEAAGARRPFFLTVSFTAVHPPYHVPEPFDRMYGWRAIELPASVHDTFRGKPPYQNDIMWPFHDTAHMSEDDWRRAIAYYRGFVSVLDRGVGEVLDAAKAHGLWKDTLVVFVADHGDMCAAHNRFDKGPYCYDEVLRIPLLVRAPGAAPREVRRHVSSIDLNRTIAEWAGWEPDAPNTDSRSLLPLIERGDPGWSGPDQAFYRYEWYDGLWFGIRAIRTHDFKYCFNPAGVDELYDLRKDPAEMHNLAGAPGAQSVENEMARRLLAHLEECGDAAAAAKMRAARH
ncbi:MAG: sulfatase-like hydrolase/transferase [Bryobacteraceae bacterium]